jgi:hypothetical protein
LQTPKPAAKAEAATPAVEATPAPVVAPQPPAQTQQAAVTPAPGVTIVRISSGLREDVERYLKNSQSFTGQHRFLAVNKSGSRIGIGQCNKTGFWGCGGFNNMRLGAQKSALSQCGGGCRILYEGANKVGVFEIEYY